MKSGSCFNSGIVPPLFKHDPDFRFHCSKIQSEEVSQDQDMNLKNGVTDFTVIRFANETV